MNYVILESLFYCCLCFQHIFVCGDMTEQIMKDLMDQAYNSNHSIPPLAIVDGTDIEEEEVVIVIMILLV